jgi:hypothetical protein
MGRSSFSSSRSSINGDLNIEGLPLYSDLTITPPADLTAPNEKATPDEVRSFLIQLLVQNRGLHHDHARRIASKWTLGTGRELMSYTPTLYAEIFGLEDAWMVYKEAKLFILTQKKKGKPKGICKLIILVLLGWTIMLTIACRDCNRYSIGIDLRSSDTLHD